MTSEDSSVGDLANTLESVLVTTTEEAKLAKEAPSLWRFLLLNFVLIIQATAAMLTVALLATLSSAPPTWLGLLSTIGWFGIARSARHKMISKYIVVWFIFAASGNYSENPLPFERITAIYLCSTAFPWLPHYLIMSESGQLEDHRDYGLYGAIQQTGPIGALVSVALQWASGMLIIPLASRIIAERPLGEFEAIDVAAVKWILLAAFILLVLCWPVDEGRASDGEEQLIEDVFATAFLTSLNYVISLGSSIGLIDPERELKAGKEAHVLCAMVTIALALSIVSWNPGKKYPGVAFPGNVKNFVFDGRRPPISLRDTLQMSEEMRTIQWRRRCDNTPISIVLPSSLGELILRDVLVFLLVNYCVCFISASRAVGIFIAHIGWTMIGWCLQDGEYSSSLILWSIFVAYGSPREESYLLARPLSIALIPVLFVFLPLATSTRFVDVTRRGPHFTNDIVQLTKLHGPLPLVRFVSCAWLGSLLMFPIMSQVAATIQTEHEETFGQDNDCAFLIAGVLIFLSLVLVLEKIKDLPNNSAISETSEPPESSMAEIAMSKTMAGTALIGTSLNVVMRIVLSKEFLASATGQAGSVCINLGIEAVLIVGSTWRRRQRHADQYEPDDSWRLSDFSDMFTTGRKFT